MRIIFLGCFFILMANHVMAQSRLWGTATGGGNNFDGGSIYSTDAQGNNLQLEYKFTVNTGHNPFYNNVIQASNGKLYGMISHDVFNGYGVIFEYNPVTHLYKELYELSPDFGIPYGSFIQASDGYLYGMTYIGGANFDGTIFKFDIASNTATVVYEFESSTSGKNPMGNLLQASNGLLYGMTYTGGANNRGTLFEFDISSNSFSKKIDFTSTSGGNPRGSLLQAFNGKLYGYTSSFGQYSNGTLFEFDITTNTFSKLIDFQNTITGRFPYGTPIQTPDSLLYGLTKGGGSLGDYGTLFSFNTSTNTLTKKADFTTSMGRDLRGSLVLAPNGNMYGVSYAGGAQQMGALFEYNPSTNALTNKVSLDSIQTGKNSYGSLFLANNGLMYGMTYGGGLSNKGVFFSYDYTSNTMTKEQNLASNEKGYYVAFLVDGMNGKLYGATAADDFGQGYGTFFEFDTLTKSVNVKKQITESEGIGYTKMVKAPDGNFYGTCPWGGINSVGSIYKYNPVSDSISFIHAFTGTDGANPEAKLMLADDGNLYGTTSLGGIEDAGVLYKLDIATQTVTKLHDFLVSSNSYNPNVSLCQASNHKLYSTTLTGVNNLGSLYEYDINTNTITTLFNFDTTMNRGYPSGALVELSNGILSGSTTIGAPNGYGTIYNYNIALDTVVNWYHFDSTISGAIDELLDIGNHTALGVSYFGGNFGKGTLYAYDYLNNSVSIQQHFNDSLGAYPWVIPIKIVDTTTSNTTPITLNIKTFLQGYYMGSSSMASTLFNQGMTSNSLLCDSITVALHQATAPFSQVYSCTSVLSTQGNLLCQFPESVTNQSYYIVLIHRNSIHTWSANPVLLSNQLNIDFTTAASQAYGSNQTEVEPGVFAIYTGDINQDGFVDSFDFPALDSDIFNGVSGVYVNTDLNGDGFVDSFDFPLLDANSFNGVSVMLP